MFWFIPPDPAQLAFRLGWAYLYGVPTSDEARKLTKWAVQATSEVTEQVLNACTQFNKLVEERVWGVEPAAILDAVFWPTLRDRAKYQAGEIGLQHVLQSPPEAVESALRCLDAAMYPQLRLLALAAKFHNGTMQRWRTLYSVYDKDSVPWFATGVLENLAAEMEAPAEPPAESKVSQREERHYGYNGPFDDDYSSWSESDDPQEVKGRV